MIHIKQKYCLHTGTDGRGGSDIDFVAAVADDYPSQISLK